MTPYVDVISDDEGEYEDVSEDEDGQESTEEDTGIFGVYCYYYIILPFT